MCWRAVSLGISFRKRAAVVVVFSELPDDEVNVLEYEGDKYRRNRR